MMQVIRAISNSRRDSGWMITGTEGIISATIDKMGTTGVEWTTEAEWITEEGMMAGGTEDLTITEEDVRICQ